MFVAHPSLGSGREAFLSQNISTCMCSFTFNPAFHQNSKVFSYNLALPLIYWFSLWFTVQGVRPFAVKISVLVCVVSHLILLSTKTARYSVIIWPSLWFTGSGVRPFSVKISVLVCVVSHLILLSTKTARYSVIIWPTLWFTGSPSDLLFRAWGLSQSKYQYLYV